MEDGPRRLVQAALDDPEAFAAIIDRHKGMVYSVAWHFFGNRSLAEDLAQDVFLELFRRLRTIDSDAHLTFWLRRAITTKCIDHARWMKNRAEQQFDDSWDSPVAPSVVDPLLAEAVRKRVRSLPEEKRLVIILRYQEEMELAEIAEVMRMPVNTVKSTLHRALALLRDKLSGFEAVKNYGTA